MEGALLDPDLTQQVDSSETATITTQEEAVVSSAEETTIIITAEGVDSSAEETITTTEVS